ncbi:MAG: dihydroneopterin aldolase [Candidatus Azobacteroides sp.]|nr:dihydroneopterin aldolase [Candidatus Azobacteroides sp.]
MTEQYILLENMRFYSYHGVFEQEQQVGNRFEVNLKIKTDFSAACISDEVEDTVSYAEIYNLISEEMAVPSRLLEHVAGRIIERIRNSYVSVSFIEVKLSKLHPPLGGEVEKASVLLIWEQHLQ